ncbi:MAG: plasmid stabilization protein [Bacteroidetes bacterium CG18_big_fil_WC_8_21_14_2_50_41_14]|nr:MAG: plasmid stabilization protein [Bacteroidetes bacterium CG18_big_fil_WC_8_21_14_2_50_41_14]PJB57549.1 MAG: type II toxin-antitoxin system RelE/ParE family toxin [Bacteroidetes bacterium CG_4_9_14_3_um_filter_41_19]
MKIIWSGFAIEMLKEIFIYHKEVAGNRIAKRIRTKIFSTTKQLRQHPNSGQIEPTLEILKEGHRYLVIGNYKVVYKEVSEGILITDIFDTRQDPIKINNPERKPSR